MGNINIRDLIGPTPRIGGSYEEIFEEVRTILRAWVNLGTLDISDKVAFNILSSWDVKNTGTAPGYAGLKLSIIRVITANPDQLWWQYSPLSREGGPGKVADIMSRTTGGAASATFWGTPIMRVDAGATVVLSCNFEIPGPLVSAAANFWYDSNPNPEFKVGVEVIELGSLSGEHIRSVGDRTLSIAFALRAARVMAPALSVVGEPSLSVTLVPPVATLFDKYLTLIKAWPDLQHSTLRSGGTVAGVTVAGWETDYRAGLLGPDNISNRANYLILFYYPGSPP